MRNASKVLVDTVVLRTSPYEATINEVLEPVMNNRGVDFEAVKGTLKAGANESPE